MDSYLSQECKHINDCSSLLEFELSSVISHSELLFITPPAHPSLKENGNKNTQNQRLKFLEHIISKEGLAYLILKGCSEDKR